MILSDVFIKHITRLKMLVLLLLLLLLLLLYDMDVSCHRPFLPGTSLEPAAIPTAQASSFTLQYLLLLLLLLLLLNKNNPRVFKIWSVHKCY